MHEKKKKKLAAWYGSMLTTNSSASKFSPPTCMARHASTRFRHAMCIIMIAKHAMKVLSIVVNHRSRQNTIEIMDYTHFRESASSSQ